MRPFYLVGCSAIALAPLLIEPTAALAQAAPASSEIQNDEIVVTANRREQALQDVPFAVTALSGAKLEELGASGFDILANRIPGLQSYQASPLNTQFFMRGVTSGALGFDQVQQSASVGIYFSEVSSDLSAMNPNFLLFDIDRVEALRGPQGTLYGAGSQAGSIRIIPRRASTQTTGIGGGVSLSETRYGGFNQSYDFALNAPIVANKVGVRVVGYYANTAGTVDSIPTGKPNADDYTVKGLRASVRIQPVDALTVDMMFAYQKGDLGGSNQSYIALGKFESGGSLASKDTNKVAELVATYDFGGVTATSVTGYASKHQPISYDINGFSALLGAPPGTTLDFPTDQIANAFSQEVRLQSRGNGPLAWIVGGFYSKSNRDVFQVIDSPGIEAKLGFPVGPLFGTTTDRLLKLDYFTKATQYAAFAQLSYKILGALELTVGGRYFQSSRNGDYFAAGIFNNGPDANLSNVKESGFNPNFNISYDITRDHKLYALASRGFRLGGTNYQIPANICQSELNSLGYITAPRDFGSDHLWNYEIGSKNSFDNGNVTLNVSAYNIVWSNIQTKVTLACGNTFQDNLGDATIKGLEAELNVRVTPHLSIGGTATFTDAKMKDSVPAVGIAGGERLPLTPRFAASSTVDYKTPVSSGVDLFVSGDLQYVGRRKTGVTTVDSFDLASFALANFRVGLNRGPWTAFVFANNLFDGRAELDHGLANYSTIPGEYFRYAQPRTIGVTVRRHL